MRQTLSDLVTICQNSAGKDTSTASATFFKQRINARYEEVLSKLPSYSSEVTRTFSTVEDQQYYHYPPNIREIEGLMITIGDVDYNLEPIHSNAKWNRLNAIDIQAGALPLYYFKRQRDFGIYPIPQEDDLTVTITYSIRAGGMTFTDYTTGTVAVTENDETVTVTTGNFTTGAIKADMWFSLTDSAAGESYGSWYRIASVTDATHLELESVFEETTNATAYYVIGDSPELPEDLHELLAFGAVADYYAGFRQSPTKAQAWENKFYTGDFNNTNRDPRLVKGGLIDGIRRYEDRDDSQLIKRVTSSGDAREKVWATTLSDSE